MTPLTVEEVLFLHHRIVVETGGSDGVRDLGLVEAALLRADAGFGDHQLFPTLFDKAAAILDALVRNHPFVDGNKRTGISTAALLLVRNGYRLTASQQEVVEFALRVALDRPEIPEISRWLEVHAAEA